MKPNRPLVHHPGRIYISLEKEKEGRERVLKKRKKERKKKRKEKDGPQEAFPTFSSLQIPHPSHLFNLSFQANNMKKIE